jgi:hypothetical protein
VILGVVVVTVFLVPFWLICFLLACIKTPLLSSLDLAVATADATICNHPTRYDDHHTCTALNTVDSFPLHCIRQLDRLIFGRMSQSHGTVYYSLTSVLLQIEISCVSLVRVGIEDFYCYEL